jgi:CDP-diacylglycerol--serine O-phosphatidyltransferase
VRLLLRPSPVDLITLGSLALGFLALDAAIAGALTGALALLLCSLLTDMLDGAVARRWTQATVFGRVLDSLVDVVLYLIVPVVIVRQMGTTGTFSTLAALALLSAGVLRLAWFSDVGFTVADGRPAYPGLPVFWTHPFAVAAYALWHWLGPTAEPLVAAAMLLLSAAMLWDRPFWKPAATRFWAPVILVAAAGFAALAYLGVRAP